MTDQICREIKIPIWLIAILISLAITLTTVLWRQAHTQGQIIEQVKQLRLDIDSHIIITRSQFNNKVSRYEIERIYNVLDRIEHKVDRLNGD